MNKIQIDIAKQRKKKRKSSEEGSGASQIGRRGLAWIRHRDQDPTSDGEKKRDEK